MILPDKEPRTRKPVGYYVEITIRNERGDIIHKKNIGSSIPEGILHFTKERAEEIMADEIKEGVPADSIKVIPVRWA